jgi:cupin fold WbuC family metalloprotein
VQSPPIKRLTQNLIAEIVEKSRRSPRRRQNYNFHELEEKVQRFVNVLQPGTYVRPHRHRRPSNINGFEFFLVIQGQLGLIIMNDQGEFIQKELLSATGDIHAIEIPEGTIHTLVALAPDTVMLELKEGPYNVNTDKDFLENFPLEGTPEAIEFVKTWQSYFD